MNLGPDAAFPAPCGIAQRLGGVLLQRIEDELGEDDSGFGEAVEMPLGHSGDQQGRAGMELDSGPPHPARRRARHLGKRGHQIGREAGIVEARRVQFARRNHGRGAAVQIVPDPSQRVLRRGPFAEHRMDVTVHDTRQNGRAAGIDGDVVGGVGRRIERRDAPVFDQQAGNRRRRRIEVAGEELADIADQRRWHVPSPAGPAAWT